MNQQEQPKLWTWQYSLIVIITFLFFLGLQALMGGFPVFVNDLTHDPSKGGLMTTAFMVAAIITRPFIGILMHKVNMKITLISAVLFLLITIAFSFGQENFSLLIFLRVLQGICFGICTTLLATLATNLIPSERTGEGIGYFGMATSLGTTFGPMVALTMVHSYSFERLLVMSLIITVLTAIGGIFIKNKKNAPSARPVSNHSLMDYAFDKKALIPCILVCLFYISFSGIVNFLDGLGTENNLGGKVSLYFLVIAAMMVLIRPFSGKIFDRMGHQYLVYPASIFGIIGLLLLAETHGLGLLSISGIFYGIAYGIMQPTFQAWAVKRVSPDKKGTANAMALSFMDLGMAVGSVILGQAAGIFGYNGAFGLSSILILLLFIIYGVTSFVNRNMKKTLNTTL